MTVGLTAMIRQALAMDDQKPAELQRKRFRNRLLWVNPLVFLVYINSKRWLISPAPDLDEVKEWLDLQGIRWSERLLKDSHQISVRLTAKQELAFKMRFDTGS